MKRTIKFFACTISAAYLATNVLWAYTPESNFWSDRRKNRSNDQQGDALLLAGLPKGAAADPQTILEQLSQIKEQPLSPQIVATAAADLPRATADRYAPLLASLPFALGTLRNINVAKGSAAKTIVHIQDVHLNEEAQRNIGGTVQSLLDSTQIDLVALEGAFGPLQMDGIREFPQKNVIEGVADYMLRQGKISGAVFAGLTRPALAVPFLGVDDKTHYDANVEAYRRSEKRMAPVAEALQRQAQALNAQKSKIFNADLQSFDKTVLAYRAETLPLTDYVKFLVEQDPKGAGAQERTLAQAAELEKALEFKAVESDRAQLIRLLTVRLDPAELKALLQHSVAYRLGQIPHGAFYAFLRDLCRSNGVDLSKFLAMDAYVRYVLLSDRINADALFSEITQSERSGYARLANTDEEIRLMNRSRLNGLSLKLANFSLTPSEWKEYITLRSKGSPEWIERLAPFESFYTEAEARNDAITQNLLKAMDEKGAKTAVLVTGGFHAPGIESRLSQANVTTIAYVPKIAHVDTKNGSAYLSVFSQEKTPLEKLFEGQKLFTAPPVFSAATREEMVRALPPAAQAAGLGAAADPHLRMAGPNTAQLSWTSGAQRFVTTVTAVRDNLKVVVNNIQTLRGTGGWNPWTEQVRPYLGGVAVATLAMGLALLIGDANPAFFQWGTLAVPPGVAGLSGIPLGTMAARFAKERFIREHGDVSPEKRSYLSNFFSTFGFFTVATYALSLGGFAAVLSSTALGPVGGFAVAGLLSFVSANLVGLGLHEWHDRAHAAGFRSWAPHLASTSAPKETGKAASALVAPLETYGLDDLARVGGKTANLGVMIDALNRDGRINVPPGFATPAETYQHFIEKAGLSERIGELLKDLDIHDYKQLTRVSEEITRLILNTPMPADLETAILRQFDELARQVGLTPDQLRIAVRSSGTAEDVEMTPEIKAAFKAIAEKVGGTGSSAGQQETFLNVRREDVVARFKECYASLFRANAIAYRDGSQAGMYFLARLGEADRKIFAQWLIESKDEGFRHLGGMLENIERGYSRAEVQRAVEAYAAAQPGRLAQTLRDHYVATYAPMVDPLQLSISVVFQKMVKSASSFVIFGYDPQSTWTGLSFQPEHREAAYTGRVFRLQVSYGLGEAVVQGITNPDSFLIHVFTDAQGVERVNIIERTRGLKKLQIIYMEDVLRELGVTRADLAGVAAGAANPGAAIPAYLAARGIRSRPDVEAFYRHLKIAGDWDISKLDEYRLPAWAARRGFNKDGFVRMAHAVKALEADPLASIVRTFVPVADQDRFSVDDPKVIEVARLAARASALYPNDVRDMEGAVESEGRLTGVPMLTQSRSITTPTEIKDPNVLEINNTVVDIEAATEIVAAIRGERGEEERARAETGQTPEAIRMIKKYGMVAAKGEAGRGAAAGYIFYLDRESKQPYAAQLAAAIDYCAKIAKEEKDQPGDEHEKLGVVLRGKSTYPDDEPAMQKAKAVAADDGGTTSHAAIVGRELKKPVVVGFSTFLEGLRRQGPAGEAAAHEIEAYLRTQGNVVTNDANEGNILFGRMPIALQKIRVAISRLPKLLYTTIGLIVASPAAMRGVSKIATFDGHYGVSLARAEFGLATIGIHPRALEAYDNARALAADPSLPLSERERADVARLTPALTRAIEEKIKGYPSAKEFYISRMADTLASMGAANALDQKVQYRMTDFKQNEMREMIGGPEFSAAKEEATMIGDRGAGWLLKEENSVAFGMEIEALKRAYAMGYTNLGIMLPFVRTPDELRAWLDRLNELDLPLKSVGMMCELPSNVVQADEFAKRLADHARAFEAAHGYKLNVYFSFGTNDLTQLTQVAGREEPGVKSLYKEESVPVIESIRHVATVVRQTQRANPGLDFTLGLCGQAIVKLVDTDPAAAKEIIGMLNSAGVDILAYPKVVKLIAESELDHSELAGSGDVVATLKTDRPTGAAARRLTGVQSLGGLADVYAGEFATLNTVAFESKDVTASTWLEVKDLFERVERESLNSALKAFVGGLRKSLPRADAEKRAAINTPAFRRSLATLLLLESIDRAGAVIRPDEGPEDLAEVLRLDGAPLAEDAQWILRGIVKAKPVLRGSTEPLIPEIGQTVTVDFATGRIFRGELDLRRRSETEKPDLLAPIAPLRSPREDTATFVGARALYAAFDVHPAAVGKTRFAGALRDQLRRALAQSPQTIVYQTGDLNSSEFRQMTRGRSHVEEKPEENAALGLGGLHRYLSRESDRALLKAELAVLREMALEAKAQKKRMVVQATDVRSVDDFREFLFLAKDAGLRDPSLQETVSLGLRLDTPANYLQADEFIRAAGPRAGVSIDEKLLAQRYLAADASNPDVQRYFNQPNAGLLRITARLRHAAAVNGATWLTDGSAVSRPGPAAPSTAMMLGPVERAANLLFGRIPWTGVRLGATALFAGLVELAALPLMIFTPRLFAALHGEQTEAAFDRRVAETKKLRWSTVGAFALAALLGAVFPDGGWSQVLWTAAAAGLVVNAAHHAIIDAGAFRDALSRAEAEARLIADVLEQGPANSASMELLLPRATRLNMNELSGPVPARPLYDRLLKEALARELASRGRRSLSPLDILEGLTVSAALTTGSRTDTAGQSLVPAFIKSPADMAALAKKLPTDAGVPWTVVPVLVGPAGLRAWSGGEAALRTAAGDLHKIGTPLEMPNAETLEAPAVASLLDAWAKSARIPIENYRWVLALSRGLQWDPASMDLLPANHPLRNADVFVLGLYMPLPIKLIQFLELEILADNVVRQMA